MGVSKNGWFIMENLAKMDDLGGTPFMETTKCLHFQEELEDGTANF